MIKILLADDHTILREGLKSLLSTEPDIEIIGEVSNGYDAIAVAGRIKPDIVLMDIGMPVMNGIEATKKLKEQYPEIKVLILTQYDSQEYLFTVLSAGASGYVLKRTASSELVWAIKTVHEGLAYLSPVMTQTLIREYLKTKDTSSKTKDVLTPREQEVLKLIAEGLTNQEIADTLVLSLKTVQTHRAHIMEKLNFHDRTELVKYAIKKGVISVDESQKAF